MVCEKHTVTELTDGRIPCVRIEGVDRFDVSKVFDCGQSFRFDRVHSSKHENEFAGCAHGRYISVAQDGDTLYIYNSTAKDYAEIWEKYLALDRDYAEIDADILSLSDNPTLKEAIFTSSGIRILRQDSWEAICSFIISQNNNIPRIKKIIASLSEKCGERVNTAGMEDHIADLHADNEGCFYSFPSPKRVLSLGVDGLFALKTGFRAKYIYDAAEKMANGEIDLSLLENADNTAICVDHLCSVKGIGPKVASCALLFGFARLDAFPVDVWIKKVAAKYFDDSFSPNDLGRFAGVAQQYLFYYERYLVNEKGENKK
jgi:N-glycosylase/DNA lyase